MRKALSDEGDIVRIDEQDATLDHLTVNFRSNLIVMRWLTFLLERIKREDLPQLFSYYQRIGWLGKRAEETLVQISEGTKHGESAEGNLTIEDEEIENRTLLLSKGSAKGPAEKPIEGRTSGWQLTPQEHIKSWVFITEIKGELIDRNLWVDLETRMDSFEFNIEEYYRI